MGLNHIRYHVAPHVLLHQQKLSEREDWEKSLQGEGNPWTINQFWKCNILSANTQYSLGLSSLAAGRIRYLAHTIYRTEMPNFPYRYFTRSIIQIHIRGSVYPGEQSSHHLLPSQATYDPSQLKEIQMTNHNYDFFVYL